MAIPAPDASTRRFAVSRADMVAHKDGDAHRQPRDDHSDRMEELTSGRDARLLAGTGKLSDDNQICRPVHGLQKERQQYGKCKYDQ